MKERIEAIRKEALTKLFGYCKVFSVAISEDRNRNELYFSANNVNPDEVAPLVEIISNGLVLDGYKINITLRRLTLSFSKPEAAIRLAREYNLDIRSYDEGIVNPR